MHSDAEQQRAQMQANLAASRQLIQRAQAAIARSQALIETSQSRLSEIKAQQAQPLSAYGASQETSADSPETP